MIQRYRYGYDTHGEISILNRDEKRSRTSHFKKAAVWHVSGTRVRPIHIQLEFYLRSRGRTRARARDRQIAGYCVRVLHVHSIDSDESHETARHAGIAELLMYRVRWTQFNSLQ